MTDRSPLPSSAGAVVIGAGAFGFAAAYHLAKAGIRDVVLLDQFEPGTQVSARAAGMFKLIQSSEVKTRLAQKAVEIVTGFEAESGVPLPYIASGSIYAARTPQHASMVEAEVEDSRGWGVRLDRFTNEEVSLSASFMNGKNILSAYFVADDIYIEEPRTLLMAYRQAGARLGMKTIGHTPATGIVLRDGAVQGVETPFGRIETDLVVDSAGAWARTVSRFALVDIPIQPLRHHVRISSPIQGVAATEPMVRLIDAAAYLRPSRGGLMYGGMEHNPLTLDPATIPGFSIDNLTLDHTCNDQFADALKSDVPALDGAFVQEERGGLFTMTPDGMLLAGPAPGVRGFWLATGCNGTGFSLSSGVGHYLAEWITTGSPSIDMSRLDPARFAGQTFAEDDLRQNAIWQYANYYTPR